MRRQSCIIIPCLFSLLSSCSSKDRSQHETIPDSSLVIIDTTITPIDTCNDYDCQNSSITKTTGKYNKIIVPKFSLLKREREDYNEYTARTRFHIRTPKLYGESELNIIADSLLKKEIYENGISEIWVNYYLPNKKIHHSNSYGLSIRLKNERSTTILREKRKHMAIIRQRQEIFLKKILGQSKFGALLTKVK